MAIARFEMDRNHPSPFISDGCLNRLERLLELRVVVRRPRAKVIRLINYQMPQVTDQAAIPEYVGVHQSLTWPAVLRRLLQGFGAWCKRMSSLLPPRVGFIGLLAIGAIGKPVRAKRLR